MSCTDSDSPFMHFRKDHINDKMVNGFYRLTTDIFFFNCKVNPIEQDNIFMLSEYSVLLQIFLPILAMESLCRQTHAY